MYPFLVLYMYDPSHFSSSEAMYSGLCGICYLFDPLMVRRALQYIRLMVLLLLMVVQVVRMMVAGAQGTGLAATAAGMVGAAQSVRVIRIQRVRGVRVEGVVGRGGGVGGESGAHTPGHRGSTAASGRGRALGRPQRAVRSVPGQGVHLGSTRHRVS